MGEDNVISSVFEDILSALLIGRKIQSRNDFLENLIVNSKKEISRNSIEFKTSSFFREILDQFLIDIPRQINKLKMFIMRENAL